MTADTVEILALIVASLVFIGGIVRCIVSLAARVSNHEVRITTGEGISKDTARILERSSLQLAAIEERTKHL